jgi:hypothetical protein
VPLRLTRPIALERLSVDGDGLVVHELKRPFRDGTTHVLFEPLDFFARLAAPVPRPRVHLLRYHGVFAPNGRHRHLLVGRANPPAQASPHAEDDKPIAAMSWMQRLHRVFAIDICTCPRCGANLRIIVLIDDPALIHRILEHVDARERVARAPPSAHAA